MKPKTKLHHMVLALSKKLPRITQKHRDWAYANMFKFRVYKTQHLAVCFECGHKWREETNLVVKLNGVICPKCKKNLEYTGNLCWSRDDRQYWNIITTVKEFQVIRVFEIIHDTYKGRKAHYSCSEVYQHWIRSDMKQVCISKDGSCNMFSYGRVNWNYGSDFEIRNHENNRYHQNISKTYPGVRVLPEIKRNGFKGNFYGYSAIYFFKLLLTDPVFEILLKTKQIPALNEYHNYRYSINTEWRYVRICIRNKYVIPEWSIWYDYLELLRYFKKDISNPKFICPDNLREEHDKLVVMKREKQERESEEKKREKERIEKEILKTKKHLFPLKFTNGNIDIVVLKTIKDFKTEGKVLNHCVYESNYHKKVNSLIMSARKNAERLETIEVSLIDFKLLQARGYDNKSSIYHDEIVGLVNKNLHKIKRIVTKNVKNTANISDDDFDDED